MKRILIAVLLCGVLLSACGPKAPTSAPTEAASTAVPRFEKADCPFVKPAGHTVECGYLIVPASRSKDDGKTIKLAVATFKTAAASPMPDPILYLEGGPGGSPLRSYPEVFDLLLAPFMKNRDLILLDQRGTGYSTPALDCPDVVKLSYELMTQTIPGAEKEKKINDALIACQQKFKDDGIDLSVFTSRENAADVADLRTTLGIKEWNLFGASYGTRLALTVMRDFPEGTRSVIIDSVYPPQTGLDDTMATNFNRALTEFFNVCAADAKCSAAYPDLKKTFFDLVARLNASPARVPMTLPDGTRIESIFTGDDMVGFIFQSLYATSLLPSLPQIIKSASEGNYVAISSINSQFLKSGDKISRGMFFSVECYEEVPFESADAVAKDIKLYPEFGNAFGSPSSTFTICNAWNQPKPPALENQPVTSDIPTLVFSGQFDPITPPSWAQEAAKTLSKSYYFNLPGSGHGASISETCPRNMVLAFLDDPSKAPNSTCITSEMSKFAFQTPVDSVNVNLKPFDDASMKLSSVKPDSWSASMTGVYSPSGKITDATQIMMQSAPMTADVLLNNLIGSLKGQNVDMSTTPASTRTANGITWKLYEADAGTAYVDLALGELNGTTYLVLLQSAIPERNAMYKAVFLPAVDALKPLK